MQILFTTTSQHSCGTAHSTRQQGMRTSSTAVVKLSIVTCAMSGVPNLLCTISPCSVTRSPACMHAHRSVRS